MIIDGNSIADRIKQECLERVRGFQGRRPCLTVILVGQDPASEIYVNRKTKACELVGIHSVKRHFPVDISEGLLLTEIQRLNDDPAVDGILVQLPLPSHIDSGKVTRAISPGKDVDGFHPLNMGKLLIGETDGFVPCTPLAVRELLHRYKIDVRGKHAVIVGRSTIVGKPMAALLMMRGEGGDATVTVAHSQSKSLKEICLTADILISAIGKPNFITADMVKEGAVVIDVGINRIEAPGTTKGYRIVGDVDFENVKDKSSFITPVPGGVGPMTIAMLLQNTIKSYVSSR